jgi:hypothetical protein
MADFFTGISGFAYVGTASSRVNVTGWEVSPEAAEHRTDDTASNGYATRILGIRNCTFSMTCNFDAANNYLESPESLGIGQTVNQVKLYLNGTAGTFWSFPTARVISTPMSSRVGDVTTVTINCANDGTFTAPTGTFTASFPA